MRVSKNYEALCDTSVALCVTNCITELQREGTKLHRDRILFSDLLDLLFIFRSPVSVLHSPTLLIFVPGLDRNIVQV